MSTANGQATWVNFISGDTVGGGIGDRIDQSTAIAPHPDGGVVLAGLTTGAIGRTTFSLNHTASTTDLDWFISRVQQDGTISWSLSKDYGGHYSSGNQAPPDLAVGTDGSVYLLGTTVGTGYALLMKLKSATGNPLTAADVISQNANTQYGGRLATALDGGVYWSGSDGTQIASPTWASHIYNIQAYFVGLYDKTDVTSKEWGIKVGDLGDSLGGAQQDFGSFPQYPVTALASSSDGDVFVLGDNYFPDKNSSLVDRGVVSPIRGEVTTGGKDVLLIRVDKSGSVKWAQLWGTSLSDSPHALAVSTSGMVYVTHSDGTDIALSEISVSSGSVNWTKNLNIGNSTKSFVTVGSDGYVYIAGLKSGQGTNNKDIYLIKIDPTKVNSSDQNQFLRLSTTFGSTSNESLGGITASADGSIYITGSSDGSFGTNSLGNANQNLGSSDAFLIKLDRPKLTAMTAVDTTVMASQSTIVKFTISDPGETLSASDFSVSGGTLSEFTAIDSTNFQAKLSPTSSTNEVFIEIKLTSPRFSTDGSNKLAVFCFMKGTHIRTIDGPITVESLSKDNGQVNLKTSGGVSLIRWIGYQRRTPEFAQFQDYLPVKISAGALEDNIPVRDLYLSPDHAILVDGHLIHAKALVNGKTITQITDWAGDIEYYHIETEAHEIIYAEGVPCETFIDNVSREQFDNYAEYQALYPNTRMMKELPLPRIKFKRQLPIAIRQRLEQRVGALQDLKQG